MTHFLFGYFIAYFILKKEYDSFESFFIGMAALIPDFDMIVGIFIPFEHGVFTHTIIGGMTFTLCYSLIIWLIGYNFLKEIDINFQSLFILALIGMFSHLFLDSFTFYYSYESDATHHMFFWPFWNFPFHINTMFPSATFELRVWIEILFSSFLIIIVIIYGGIIKKENPLLVFIPKHWSKYCNSKEKIKHVQFCMYSLFIFNLIILFLVYIHFFK
ncbi:MAG: metal-dependent hydrolase [Promethearchaeota archaeon]